MVTNSANNGEVLAGILYIKESVMKAGEYRGNLEYFRNPYRLRLFFGTIEMAEVI